MTKRFCGVAAFVFLASFSLQFAQAHPSTNEHATAGTKEQPARAVTSITDEKWHTCEADDQCVLVYKCDDDAVNKQKLNEYQELAKTAVCKTTLTHNPEVVARCVHNNCTASVERSHR